MYNSEPKLRSDLGMTDDLSFVYPRCSWRHSQRLLGLQMSGRTSWVRICRIDPERPSLSHESGSPETVLAPQYSLKFSVCCYPLCQRQSLSAPCVKLCRHRRRPPTALAPCRYQLQVFYQSLPLLDPSDVLLAASPAVVSAFFPG